MESQKTADLYRKKSASYIAIFNIFEDTQNSHIITQTINKLSEETDNLLILAQSLLVDKKSISLDDLSDIEKKLISQTDALEVLFTIDTPEHFTLAKFRDLMDQIIEHLRIEHTTLTANDALAKLDAKSTTESSLAEVTVDIIQSNIDHITTQLNFALSRLNNGANDDIAKKPIIDAIGIYIPNLVNDVSKFINSNYDDNDKLVDEINSLNTKLSEFELNNQQLTKENGIAAKEIIALGEELKSAINALKSERMKKQNVIDEFREYKKQNPPEFRENNAKLKSENTGLRNTNRTTARELSVLKATNKHLTNEYAALEVNFQLAYQSQKNILDEMDAISGFAGMGKYGYSINKDNDEWGYIHVFYRPKSLFLLRGGSISNEIPKGQRVIENLTFHIMYRTNTGLSLELDLSEWGGVTYIYHKVFKGWIGDNVIVDAQQNYDAIVAKHNPDIAARTAYFRSIEVKDIEGITEPLYIKCQESLLRNVSEIGSHGIDRLVNELGFKKKEAEKLMALIMPYMEKWDSEHGEPVMFDKHSTEEEQKKVRKIIEKDALETATAKVKEEHEQLVALVRKTLPESYGELYTG